MTTRKRVNDAPTLSDLEGAANPVETPGIMPPPGVQARIRTQIDYDRTIDPSDTAHYSDELRRLAGEEIDEDELPAPQPQDPYTEFINTWRKYIGYPLKVVRLPDPADKRIPGNTYNKPCFELTMLSDTPFDPNNLIGTLQVINNNSGGVFRIFLTDEYGQPIPGARLDRLVIADPPKQYNQTPQQQHDLENERYYRYRQERERELPQAPQKSETELYIEQMQRELFQKVMMRALDPPAPVTPDPLSTLSSEDRLALGLLQRGDILESAVNRIANLAQAPERLESSTWKDKLADASIQLVTHNPQIVATVTDIVTRAAVALASAFAPRAQGAQVINTPVQYQPPPPPPPQRAPAPLPPLAPPQALDGLPETPQPEDDGLDNDETEIDLMEEIIKLLLSEQPLTLNNPTLLDIKADYPEIFDQAMAGLVNMPSMVIIQYLCSKSDFCVDMFNSQRNGPYLRQRLEDLKALYAVPVTTNAVTEETATSAAEADATAE